MGIGPWSFRDKRDINKKEKDLIYKITQKLNQTLINVTQNKNKNQLYSFDKKNDEDKNYIDVFRKNTEKELEIFESERNTNFSKKNKNSLINIDCTLSDIKFGKGFFVTKDDLIFDLPSNFLNKAKCEEIGITYLINVNEISRLIPNDEYISKLHLYYSQNDNSH